MTKPFSVKSCLRPGEPVNPVTLGRIAAGPNSSCQRVARGMLAVLSGAVKDKLAASSGKAR